jgi:hypothetical protein
MTLVPSHRDELHGSGLTDETIGIAGFYSAPAAALRDLLGYGVPSGGWVIPYASNGAGPYARAKLDRAGVDGKRYRSPVGCGNHLYLPPPRLFDAAVLADAAVPLYLVEGEKKALKACQEGLPALALSGVWAWRRKGLDQHSTTIPDLDRVTWAGRTVLLVFDSDLETKPTVQQAEAALAQELARRGAEVWGYRLPPGPAGAKVGLDDFLVAHSVERFCRLEPVLLATPPPVPAPLGIGLGEFLAQTFPPLEPIVEGLLYTDGGGWIGGEEKLGKSYYAVEEALSIALGLPVCGRFPVPKRRRVFFIEEEDPPRRLHARINALLRGKGLDPTDPALRADLDAWMRLAVWVGFSFDAPALVARLDATCRTFHPAVIYGDVLRKLTLRDLNKGAEAGALLATLDQLRREHGVIFRILHHYRKTQGFRAGRGSQELGGSFQLGAWAENSLFFEPIGRKQGAVKVEVQSKDAPPAPAFTLVFESEGPVHDPLWVRLRADELTETSVRARNLDAVLQALGTVPPSAAVEGLPGVLILSLVPAVKLSDKTIRGCLKDLEAAGKAAVVGKASKGAALWAVTGQ